MLWLRLFCINTFLLGESIEMEFVVMVRILDNSVGVAISQPRVEGRSTSTLGANHYKSMLLCKSCHNSGDSYPG